LRILAIDSSATVAAVAIVDNGKLVGEYIINNKMTHSQKLMPMVSELLTTMDLLPRDIDLFAASIGPGSFTGLRIGVASIKAMAYSLEKPVISIPTLDSLAYNLPELDMIVCPIMDARNNQVYTAFYKWEENKMIKNSDYLGIPITELVSELQKGTEKVIFVGDAVSVHREYLNKELGGKCCFAPDNLLFQRASSVAQLAKLAFQEGKTESPVDMVPFYLRMSQAEREYKNKSK